MARKVMVDIDYGDDETFRNNNITEEMIEECRVGIVKSKEDEFDDELYWGFADSEQLVIVRAGSANEAWYSGARYWYEGQTITPLGVLPLNAREISNKRNYQFDKKLIWSTGPGSNQFFFDETKEERGD